MKNEGGKLFIFHSSLLIFHSSLLINYVLDSDYYSCLAHITIYPITGEALLFFLLAAISLIFSARLSASQLAYFSLNSSELQTLEESEHPIDKKITQLLSHSEQLLSSLLVTSTFANISYIIFGYYFFSELIYIPKIFSVNFLIVLLCLFVPLLLFGEIMPKLYASQDPLRVVRKWISPVNQAYMLSKPLSRSLGWLSEKIKNKLPKNNYNISLDDLSQAFEMSEEKDSSSEKELLKGIVEFGDKTAVEIMTARLDVADIDIEKDFKQVTDFFLETGYSRIPVYAESDDNIKGILYIKDLLPHLNQPASFHWQFLIREAYFVPETKKINDLLEEFRTNKIHLAIVVDEFGGTAGIVTMEDILEEIVGEISDEYDDEEKQYIRLADNTYILQGKILLNDFFKISGILEDDFGDLCNDSDTLAGLILELKGDFPETNETIDYQKYHFTILEIEKQRIVKVKLKIEDS